MWKTDEGGVPPEDTKLYWVSCPHRCCDVKGVEYDGSPSGVRPRQIKGQFGRSRGLPACRQTDVGRKMTRRSLEQADACKVRSYPSGNPLVFIYGIFLKMAL